MPLNASPRVFKCEPLHLELARQARSYRGLVLAAACQLAGFTQRMVIARGLKNYLI